MKNNVELGDTGLVISGLYRRPKDRRVMMCMADAEKGIWLHELKSPPAITPAEDVRHNWYGSRSGFDSAGWRQLT